MLFDGSPWVPPSPKYARTDGQPVSLTFDLDAVDDPTHGSQELSLFHGFYEQHQ
jgi:hypothetical protein